MERGKERKKIKCENERGQRNVKMNERKNL